MSILTRAFPALRLFDLANVLTTVNAGVAVIAMGYAQRGQLSRCAVAIFVAALLDYLDGHVARTYFSQLPRHREFGKQLDTLADLMNFSVVPAVVMLTSFHDTRLIPAVSALLVLSSALRLANFNVSSSPQSHGYVGLPTTYTGFLFANALLLHSVGHLSERVLMAGAILLAVLQLANIPIRKLPVSCVVPAMIFIFSGTVFFAFYI